MIERPKHIFIKGKRTLFQANFYAVSKQIILSNEIPLKEPCMQFGFLSFQNDHKKRARLTPGPFPRQLLLVGSYGLHELRFLW